MDVWVASYVILWLVVVALTFLMVGLLRQIGLIQLRVGADPGVLITPEGLGRGSQAPDFEAVDVQTEQVVRLADFRGRRFVLVFISQNCTACRQLAPHLNEFRDSMRKEVETVAVCYGMKRSCTEFAQMFRLKVPVLVDPENQIASQYGVRATPFAFLIDETGVVRIRGVVNSWTHLDALINEEGTVQTAPWQPASQPSASGAVAASIDGA